MVIVSCIIVFSTLRGLTRLSQNLEQINLDNLTSVTTAPYRSDELEKIRRTTAMMLERIQDEVDEKLHYQEVEKQMQYTLMVSAVDPHFIYNTLDTVSFLASMGRTEDVVTVNDALISTLKDRLRTKAYRVFDTVSVEKDVIKNYMILQTYLCANTITCQFEAEPEHMDLLIPKNILQPLVENSIKHGLLTNKTKDRLKAVDGEIRIRITHAEERIGIHILDNGSGISEEQCAYYNEERVYEDFTGEHVGLLNIKLRLNYLYKGDYTFHIANRDEGGTCIDIYIPDTPPEWLN